MTMKKQPVRNAGRVAQAIRRGTWMPNTDYLRVGQLIVNALTKLHPRGTEFTLTDLFYIEDEDLAKILEKYEERP